MKNILIISAVFPPEPVVSARLSYDIAGVLSESNKVTVISPKPSRPFGFQFSEESLDFNFNHIQVGSFICATSSIIGRFRESYSFGKHCYKYIADNHQNIDVIYANTWPLLAQYFTVKAGKKYNIPVIIHVQDIYPESLSKKLPLAKSFFNSILIPFDKYILSRASIVIAISQKMKDYLVKSRKLDCNMITVIPNWQDEETFIKYNKEENHHSEKPFTFMYLGNIGPVAGVDLLLKAFEKAQLKNSRLVIAGSGSMKESLVKYAENCTDCIIEFWPVPEGKVPEVQSLADVLLLPVKKGAAFTSVPSKLPAYMFSAKPIIACVDEDSDTAAAINDAGCGWVIQPENLNALSVLLENITAMNEDVLKTFGNNGLNYALSHLSKKNNLPKTVKIIEETVL